MWEIEIYGMFGTWPDIDYKIVMISFSISSTMYYDI